MQLVCQCADADADEVHDDSLGRVAGRCCDLHTFSLPEHAALRASTYTDIVGGCINVDDPVSREHDI